MNLGSRLGSRLRYYLTTPIVNPESTAAIIIETAQDSAPFYQPSTDLVPVVPDSVEQREPSLEVKTGPRIELNIPLEQDPIKQFYDLLAQGGIELTDDKESTSETSPSGQNQTAGNGEKEDDLQPRNWGIEAAGYYCRENQKYYATAQDFNQNCVAAPQKAETSPGQQAKINQLNPGSQSKSIPAQQRSGSSFPVWIFGLLALLGD